MSDKVMFSQREFNQGEQNIYVNITTLLNVQWIIAGWHPPIDDPRQS